MLWRIENGELDFEMNPKIVVLLVGTHNYGNTADQVAEAILKLVEEIRKRLKKSNIIVLSIPPRGREINVLREKIIRINQLVEKSILNNGNTDPLVSYLCCSRWHEFVNPQDGFISHNDM